MASSMLGGITGGLCDSMLGRGAIEFRPTTLVALGRDGSARVLYHVAYRGGGSRVVVLPRVHYDQILEYTASADAGVLLYRNTCRNNYFCAPNKIHEYMMRGLPVVANDYPGMKKLVDGERVGFAIDGEDPRLIADAVNRLADPAGPYRELRENALRAARDRYNWEQQFARLEAEYLRLLGPASSSEAPPPR